MFGDTVPLAGSPEHFKNLVDHYLSSPDERSTLSKQGHELVKRNHTNIHRACQILSEFGVEDVAERLIKQYEESLEEGDKQ